MQITNYMKLRVARQITYRKLTKSIVFAIEDITNNNNEYA